MTTTQGYPFNPFEYHYRPNVDYTLRTKPTIPVDVQETSNAYIIVANVPGFESENISVNIRHGSLYIEAEKKTSDEGTHLLQERETGKLNRVIRLPGDIDREKLTASLKDGVLTINIPKIGGRRIDIGEASEDLGGMVNVTRGKSTDVETGVMNTPGTITPTSSDLGAFGLASAGKAGTTAGVTKVPGATITPTITEPTTSTTGLGLAEPTAAETSTEMKEAPVEKESEAEGITVEVHETKPSDEEKEIEPETRTEEELMKLKVTDLKLLCKKKGLKQNGKKNELIKRLKHPKEADKAHHKHHKTKREAASEQKTPAKKRRKKHK